MKPSISVSGYKAWNDDQVFKMLADQHNELNSLNKSISAKELQEISQIKQATQKNFSGSASPATGGLVRAPEGIESETLSLDNLTQPSGEIGLSHSSLLRGKVDREWDLLGRDLLYLGDMQVLDDAKKLVLVRFDISINNYLDLGGRKDFAYVKFILSPNAKVYFLSPEYKSIVSRESLITSRLEDYAAQLGAVVEGFDVQTAMRYQRALEEGFIRLIESPTEFGVYGNKPNEYAFAFGPRRRIVKRSWLNPKRIFGDKYRLDYELEPGTRAVYALVIVNKDEKCLKLQIKSYDKGLVSQEETGLVSQEEATKELYKSPFVSLRNDVKIDITTQPIAPIGYIPEFTIYPKLTSTILVRVASTISANTEIFVGHMAIPKENISVLGRRLLKITIPPDNGLSELLKTPGTHKLEVKAVTPGKSDIQNIAEVILKDSDVPKKTKEYSLVPEKGRTGEDVKLTIPGSDLSSVTHLTIGSTKIDKLILGKMKDNLIFSVPELKIKKALKLTLQIHKNSDPKNNPFKYFPSAFTYLVE
ncbi:MAG: hypothetical protein KAR20_08875 [Candidatus Heimdallarchaeota archaeon]|nr:hypothetical protein [Candidatus Heimdallarchaeota archaeon]